MMVSSLEGKMPYSEMAPMRGCMINPDKGPDRMHLV